MTNRPWHSAPKAIADCSTGHTEKYNHRIILKSTGLAAGLRDRVHHAVDRERLRSSSITRSFNLVCPNAWMDEHVAPTEATGYELDERPGTAALAFDWSSIFSA